MPYPSLIHPLIRYLSADPLAGATQQFANSIMLCYKSTLAPLLFLPSPESALACVRSAEGLGAATVCYKSMVAPLLFLPSSESALACVRSAEGLGACPEQSLP
jgi:hypothetical protein